MKNTLLVVLLGLLVLIPIHGLSQLERFKPYSKPDLAPFNEGFPSMILSVYPSRILNPIHTGLELGFEFRNMSLLSTEIRVTQLFSNRLRNVKSSWNPEIQGNIFHLEERVYIKNSAPYGPYFALGISYMWSKYNESWRFQQKMDDNTTIFYDDTISIRKNYTDITLKFGYQGISNRFVIGFDVGIGVRYKDVRHTDKLYKDGYMREPNGINVNYIIDREIYEWIPIVPISFRLGFVL